MVPFFSFHVVVFALVVVFIDVFLCKKRRLNCFCCCFEKKSLTSPWGVVAFVVVVNVVVVFVIFS